MSDKSKTIEITAPNPDYNGISAGVRFTDGKATITVPPQAAALEYFARHRFGISEDASSGDHPDLKVSKTGDPSKPASKKASDKKASDQPAPGEPAKGAGDGPVGPQHNSGHDGANPHGDEPPVTPTDAGI